MTGKTVIVGAGVSGLTLAERLLALGKTSDVTVVESGDAPGGLAGSYDYDGFIFDIGPHRFHTSDPDVDSYLLRILGDHYVRIERSSSVYMENRYRNWPLTLGAVLGLPLPVLLRSLRDLFTKPDRSAPESFADYIIQKYGRNLYDFFFSGYTSKFTGTSGEQLHVDWAEAGVNRAVIDKKVSADNLFSLLKGVLLPKPVATTFYYPSTGGIQTFCDLQRDLIEETGGSMLLGTSATGLRVDSGRVTGVELGDGRVLDADTVYWTAPISILYPESGFRFINTVLCNIALDEVRVDNDYQWCYFGQEDLIFSRLTVPRNFRPDTVPEGCDSITAEITSLGGSPIWEDPESFTDRLVSDLQRVSAIDPSKIRFARWERVPCTYPLYDLGYRDRTRAVETPEGLILAGRCGSFWYNNMDHSIGQALAIASGRDFQLDFWNS